MVMRDSKTNLRIDLRCGANAKLADEALYAAKSVSRCEVTVFERSWRAVRMQWARALARNLQRYVREEVARY